MNRKHFLITTLISVVLLTAVFTPLSGQQDGTYDPWMDLNDDGIIDVYDLQALAFIYGTSGEPINKTALMLNLLERVEALENQSLWIRHPYTNLMDTGGTWERFLFTKTSFRKNFMGLAGTGTAEIRFTYNNRAYGILPTEVNIYLSDGPQRSTNDNRDDGYFFGTNTDIEGLAHSTWDLGEPYTGYFYWKIAPGSAHMKLNISIDGIVWSELGYWEPGGYIIDKTAFLEDVRYIRAVVWTAYYASSNSTVYEFTFDADWDEYSVTGHSWIERECPPGWIRSMIRTTGKYYYTLLQKL